ncbi:hypothetical protein GX50_07839, partial [[Emmonsia] crescens]
MTNPQPGRFDVHDRPDEQKQPVHGPSVNNGAPSYTRETSLTQSYLVTLEASVIRICRCQIQIINWQ